MGSPPTIMLIKDHIMIILQKQGFNIDGMIGVDISSNMLHKAKERKCYSSLLWADILQPLQFPENSFDYILCVGTTTYLGNMHS
jgi:predicted TPR repeat methyltransferase